MLTFCQPQNGTFNYQIFNCQWKSEWIYSFLTINRSFFKHHNRIENEPKLSFLRYHPCIVTKIRKNMYIYWTRYWAFYVCKFVASLWHKNVVIGTFLISHILLIRDRLTASQSKFSKKKSTKFLIFDKKISSVTNFYFW
jgi:hypothetical protein